MKTSRFLVVSCLFCMVAGLFPPVAADDYLGGGVLLGGSGSRITMVTTAATPAAAETVAPIVARSVGALSVTTSPAGASIFIDGVERGISPATIRDLTAGSHTLLLKLDGYQEQSVPVTIPVGQTQTSTITLLPAVTQPLPKTAQSPGFCLLPGIAALGAVFLAMKTGR